MGNGASRGRNKRPEVSPRNAETEGPAAGKTNPVHRNSRAAISAPSNPTPQETQITHDVLWKHRMAPIRIMQIRKEIRILYGVVTSVKGMPESIVLMMIASRITPDTPDCGLMLSGIRWKSSPEATKSPPTRTRRPLNREGSASRSLDQSTQEMWSNCSQSIE